MTLYDILKTVTVVVAVWQLAAAPTAAQAPSTVTTAGRAAARDIAVKSTTSAARAASALTSLRAAAPASGARAAVIVGYLWTAEGTPVSEATIRLRNLATGQVEQISTTQPDGAFMFSNVSGGTYVMEYVSKNTGQLVAVGQAFTVAPGETVATFLRLGMSIAGIAPGVVGNVGWLLALSAASAGIVGSIAPEQPASSIR